jgi:NodT family efflux transporter outer membrane factor (OMF) lipoprotein
LAIDRTTLRLGAALLALTAGGCTLGPDWQAPQADAPESWSGLTAKPAPEAKPTAPVRKASLPVNEPVNAAWWRIFNDAELSSLEQRALNANLDIRIAAVRLEEARSQRQVTGAAALPRLNANGSYTREMISKEGIFSVLSSPSSATNAGTLANGAGGTAGGVPYSTSNSPIFQPFNLYSYGFDASWEPDFWGKVSREIESADASVLASEQARRAALTSVLAEVARNYVQLRGTQRSIAITRENLGTANDSLRLTQDRFANGLTTDLDVNDARVQVGLTAAQLPALEQQQSTLINQIALLLGERPAALNSELMAAQPVPPPPPRVPVGLPSELLRRRPDIAQAEAQLHSATADIGVAEASFYPSITLSGSASLQALQFSNMGSWSALQYGFGPAITLPIFQGGQLTGTLELRKAQAREAAITYQKTVLGAWHEVANALDAYQAEQRRRDQLEDATRAARLATNLPRQRYQQGIADFLSVLDAQRSQLSAEQQLADSTATVSTNLVAIYKALGGGWDVASPEPAAPAAESTHI